MSKMALPSSFKKHIGNSGRGDNFWHTARPFTYFNNTDHNTMKILYKIKKIDDLSSVKIC